MILHAFQLACYAYVRSMDRTKAAADRIGDMERPEDCAAAIGAALDEEVCCQREVIALAGGIEAERERMVKAAVDRLIRAALGTQKPDAQ